ncbi:MAG TPA: hypothetical protein VLF91_05075 [Candidatus Saccharimonadales bacterium]|nr:hypothetical protein [Candidatus Saccharimonadales bacterium]
MPSHHKSVASLLSAGRIQELARPSDIRYGQAIHDRGGVEFITKNPTHAALTAVSPKVVANVAVPSYLS